MSAVPAVGDAPHDTEMDLPPAPRAPEPTSREPENTTDLGNARRLVRLHGAELMYSFAHGSFYTWMGTHWARDEDGEAVRRAKGVARAILDEAANEPDQVRRKALAAWSFKSEAEARISAMLTLARSEPGIPLRPDQVNADPWLLNVLNGTLDLRTGQLRAHDPRDCITHVAPVEWDAGARAPLWERFLEEVLPDSDVRGFLQRFAGYSLTGLILEHILLICAGIGANGKTTFFSTLQLLLGEYALEAEPEILLVRRGEVHPTGLADLAGRRLVVTSETDGARRFNEALVKRLTGGDRIRARRMRMDFFEFTPTHKLAVLTNHRPEVRGSDEGIWRRLRVVPFSIVVPTAQRDTMLPTKLRAELPGILRWAVDGCLAWQRDGLREPAAVLVATSQYREAEDILGAFLEDRTLSDSFATVSASELYAAYRGWADENGEAKLTQTAFGKALTERGYTRGKDAKTRRVEYGGLSLRNSPEGSDRISVSPP